MRVSSLSVRRSLQPVVSWYYRLRSAQKGTIYGAYRPAWWPTRLAWWFGPAHPYDGLRVEMKAAGYDYAFLPVAYNRYRGHMCRGHVPAETDVIAGFLSDLGYPVEDAAILSAVSANEGGFDSIQTYDRAKFSWGIIQFTGTGSLVTLLQMIKSEEPDRFQTYFAGYGVDVVRGMLQISDRRGNGALNALHDSPRLWRRFLIASSDEAVQRVQVRAAYEGYYLRMMAHSETIANTDYLYGELFADHAYGRAILFDRAVHRGIVYTSRLFKQALLQAQEQGEIDSKSVLRVARKLEPAEQHVRWNRLHDILEHSQAPGLYYDQLHN